LSITAQQGLAVGAVFVLQETTHKTGIVSALGRSPHARLVGGAISPPGKRFFRSLTDDSRRASDPDRYKDLAHGETAFRTMKTGYLETWPLSKSLLQALGLTLPDIVPSRDIDVATRQKLSPRK